MVRLPILAICNAAIAFVQQEYATVVRLTWLTVAAAVTLPSLARSSSGVLMPSWLARIAAEFVGNACLLLAAAALYRLMLLGERDEGRFLPRPLGRTEWLFLLVAAAQTGLTVASAFAALPTVGRDNHAGLLLLLLLGIPIVFVMVRLSLLLPSIVADRQLNLRRAWDLTRGNFVNLFGLFAISGLAVGFIQIPIVALSAAMGNNPASFVLDMASGWLFGVFGGAFLVAANASAYLFLKNNAEGDEEPARSEINP